MVNQLQGLLNNAQDASSGRLRKLHQALLQQPVDDCTKHASTAAAVNQ